MELGAVDGDGLGRRDVDDDDVVEPVPVAERDDVAAVARLAGW